MSGAEEAWFDRAMYSPTLWVTIVGDQGVCHVPGLRQHTPSSSIVSCYSGHAQPFCTVLQRHTLKMQAVLLCLRSLSASFVVMVSTASHVCQM